MLRRLGNKSRQPVYWWNAEVAEHRWHCLRARRLCQRARGRSTFENLRERYIEARRALKLAIKISKRRCAEELCGEVDRDPWGRPYKLVMDKLKSAYRAPFICQDLLRRIVVDLFPLHPGGDLVKIECDVNNIPPVTREELLRACRRLGDSKAPGLDGIPNIALKTAIRASPEVFIRLRTTIF